MQANPKSLHDLLGAASRFVIPEYQRPYCWTREEVEQLWNDLGEAFQDATDAQVIGADADDYFLGSVVVTKTKEKGGTVAHVVDGQQRITTLHALLWCAHARLAGEAEAEDVRERIGRLLVTPAKTAALFVAKEDQANFLALREGTPLDETRDLGVTGAFFRKRMAEWKDLARLTRFLEFALDRTSFILVETESYASAWDLFIGLNGKGRPLNAADLIKAFVCGSSLDSEAMADIWKDKVLPLGADATSALLDITRVATGDAGSEAKLFRAFERAWNAKKIAAPLLSDGTLIYGRFWRQALQHVPGLIGGHRHLRGLRSIERRDHTPLLLALGARYGAAAVFHPALLRALEAYQLWMAVRSKRGRERDFTALAAAIYSAPPDEHDARARIAALLRRLAPPLDEIRGAIRSLAYPGRHMKFVVTQYEEGLRGDVQIADVQFEHMMPKTPTKYWYAVAQTTDANAYARLVNNIGNIAPLDAQTNIAGRNDDWPTKAALYEKHVPNWLVASIAIKNPSGWTPEKIRERAEAITEWAVTQRWNLSEALDELGS